jgi:hypothetical protein
MGHVEPDHRAVPLVALHGYSSAGRTMPYMEGSAHNLLDDTLDAERLRNARLLALRATLTLGFMALTAVVALAGDVPGARARLPVVAAHCAASLVLYAAGRSGIGMEKPDRPTASTEGGSISCSCEHGTSAVHERGPTEDLAHLLGGASPACLPRRRARLSLRRPPGRARLHHREEGRERDPGASGAADHGPPIAPARIAGAGEEAPWQDDGWSCSKRCADGQPCAYA